MFIILNVTGIPVVNELFMLRLKYTCKDITCKDITCKDIMFKDITCKDFTC